MNNLLVSIKKFITNKNVVTVLGVIAILVVLYLGYSSTINKQVEPKEVPVASQTIQPRTLITEEMITYITVPAAIISDNVQFSIDSIIGMYTDVNTVIPSGSMFYEDVLVTKEELPNTAFVQVKEGERPYAFRVTPENTYGNSIFPGEVIDIYMKAVDESGQVMVGRLLEKVEVLAVKDDAGNHVFENTAEDRVPSTFLFGVPEDIFILLKKSEYLEKDGVELFPVPYGGDIKITGSIAVDREELVSFIESKTINFSDSEEEESNENTEIGIE